MMRHLDEFDHQFKCISLLAFVDLSLIKDGALIVNTIYTK